MRASSVPRWTAVVVVAALLTSCATASDKNNSTGATSPSGSGALAATARGVTAATIKVGFSYIDLAALARTGIIKIDHGPYEQIIKALVDDVNANGGINGRKLQLFTAKYSPLGNTDQLAACSHLTEDDQVFVVLNGLLTDNNLCIVQQHQTALIGGTTTALTTANLAKARAPWASASATTDRS